MVNYRPGWWARWIRQPSSFSIIAEGNKEIKEEGDSETVNSVDEKELHDMDWLNNRGL
jgi:hypothetical protein